jgi:RimJ/RimL family protein N-acetyltransferase
MPKSSTAPAAARASIEDPAVTRQATAREDALRHLARILAMPPDHILRDAGKLALDSLVALEFGTLMEAAGWPGVIEILSHSTTLADVLSALERMTGPAGRTVAAPPPVLHVPPRMRGARALLTPVLPSDTDFLYALAVSPETGFRWRFRGAVPSYQTFVEVLWEGINAQFVVRDGDARPVGHAIIYNIDFNLGLAYIGVALSSAVAGSGAGVECAEILIHYAFCTWALRICYMELPEYNFGQFASGEGRFFEVQGRLTDADIYGGRHYDRLIVAISREKFYENREVQRAAGV